MSLYHAYNHVPALGSQVNHARWHTRRDSGSGHGGGRADPSLVVSQVFTEPDLASAQRVGATCTLARASDVLTFASDGTLTTFGTNVPAMPSFSFDGTTWNNNGVLFEPAGTNLVPKPNDFADAAWQKASLTVSTDTTLAPDGTTASLATNNGGASAIFDAMTITGDATIAISIRAKHAVGSTWAHLRCATGGNEIDAWANLQTGAMGSTAVLGTGAIDDSGLVDIGGGWYVLWMVGSIGSGATAPSFVFISADADASQTEVNGDAHYIFGADLKEADELSSYVEVAATPRAATSFLLPSYSDWYDETVGFTLLMKGIVWKKADVGGTVWRVVDFAESGGATDRILLAYDPGDELRLIVVNGGATTADEKRAGFTPNASHNIAARVIPNDIKIAVDGNLSSGDTTNSLPALADLDAFGIGDTISSASDLDGHFTLKGLQIYKEAKDDTWLTAQTS